MPDDIRQSAILPTILFADYAVSCLGGVVYCTALYLFCRLRSQTLLILNELRHNSVELSSAYMPLEAAYLEQLGSCVASQAEIQGATCAICYEGFESADSRPLKLPICNHLYHENCIKEWLKLRSTCPNCRQDLHESLGT